MKCFDQRSKKREVDNLSSGWLWIAEPKVIVSFSDYVGDTNIWQNPIFCNTNIWRHQYLAKSRKTVQKASTQFLGLGQGHLSDQHHFKSICDEHTKVQRYQIIIITISLTLQYRINDVDSKIKCASEAQQSLGCGKDYFGWSIGE